MVVESVAFSRAALPVDLMVVVMCTLSWMAAPAADEIAVLQQPALFFAAFLPFPFLTLLSGGFAF